MIFDTSVFNIVYFTLNIFLAMMCDIVEDLEQSGAEECSSAVVKHIDSSGKKFCSLF